jgi:hypothetical protein
MADLATQLRDYLDATAPEVLLSEVHSLRAVRLLREETPVRRRRWLIAAVVGAAAVAAIVLAVLLWPGQGSDPAPFIDEGSTIPGITVTVPTTTVGGSGIVATSIPAEQTLPWADPLNGLTWGHSLSAVSAGEVWAPVPSPYPYDRIGRLKDGVWTYFQRNAPIAGLAVAPDGTMWVATGSGVFSFDGEQWTRRFHSDAEQIVVGEDGTVWIGGIRDDNSDTAPLWLARWNGESFVRVDPMPWDPPREGRPASSHLAMAAAPDGEVWMATAGFRLISGLMHYDGVTLHTVQIGQIADYQDEDPVTSPVPLSVCDIEVAPNGDVWVAGFMGFTEQTYKPVVLARFDGEAWTLYDWPPAVPSEQGEDLLLSDMAVGPDGVVWFASGDGLRTFDGTDWIAHIEGEPVYAVDVAPDGTVWYKLGDGLHRLSG